MLSLCLLFSLAVAQPWADSAGLTFDALQTGVQWVDLAEGEGIAAEEGSRVEVHYVGQLGDGTVFDESRARGKVFSFRIGDRQVIRGWEDGLIGAQPGTVRRLIIPPDQGYGQRAAGQIPPGSTLYFEVEVMRVIPPRKPPISPVATPEARPRMQGLLQISDLQKGEGNRPQKEERVCVDYAAWIGTELVAHTFDRENCFWFRYEPGKVSEGLYEGLRTMRAGGVRHIVAPGALVQDPGWSVTVPATVDVLLEVWLVEAMERVK